MEVKVDVRVKDGDKIIERLLNKAEELVRELRRIINDLTWYGIKLEMPVEKLSAELKNSADSEK